MHYEDGTLVRRNSECSPICHGGQTNESRNAMKGTRIVVLDGFTANVVNGTGMREANVAVEDKSQT